MKSRRAFLSKALRLAGGVALAACAPSSVTATASASPAGPKRGGLLVTAYFDDPQSLDPAQISNSSGRRVSRAIYDPLVELDSDNHVIPALAERWDTTDPLTWTFHLREGVKFHDGTPFDAQAVTFHFDRHLDPRTSQCGSSSLPPR